jgi:hypothetical protein
VQVSEDTFRALARSSPWRWRTLHFRYADGRWDVEAWLRRPGQLVVRRPGHRDQYVDERVRTGPGSSAYAILFSTRGGPPPPRPAPPALPHDVEPVRRADGLVAERPESVAYDDPMWQSYDWVAMLDPVELSHHTTLTRLREDDRLGRRTWWARVQPTEGYEPRCGCCPLLWSFVSDRDENTGGGGRPWTPEPDTVYPEAYDVALDVGTGVAVERSPVGTSSLPAWHRVSILEVDGDLDGMLPA